MSRSSGGSGDVFAGVDGIPALGDVIGGKYLVERVLGAGGMGVVLAARHTQLGQRVAIKLIRASVGQDSSAVARFLREARAAVALSSQHAAKVLDVGTLESGAPYMVMEYLAGVDLGQILRRDGPMSVSDAVSAVLQACEAIAEAHASGIVHRDLKPANLFMTKHTDGSPLVKVLDFGISKMLAFNTADIDPGLTASGSVMGSPRYMSPEQARNAKGVDRRSDVWALGVILYELLTGIDPFGGETLGETLARILSESPTPVRALRPDVPEELSTAITQCLQRSLNARIQTVAELATKLAPFASPWAAASAERIQRISGVGTGPQLAKEEEWVSGTLTAVPASGPSRPLHSRQTEGVDSEPAWLKSGTGGIASTSPRSARRWIAGAAAALAVAAGLYMSFGRPTATKEESKGIGGAVSAPLAARALEPTPTPSATHVEDPPALNAPATALSSDPWETAAAASGKPVLAAPTASAGKGGRALPPAPSAAGLPNPGPRPVHSAKKKSPYDDL